ncbi:hypothetical protein K504DRAFT_237898 [Pleomassaria siparia CBS 279.74]|uniref:Uncharacterized protein n=1 Tax=Pleomassaria siparia CBS 279.74 TaxID=1314801 RepID=A0A6G1KDN8_9PLEO|nr:hypothetical protein K504DRAFT_237898 [Pleomassaria siparia CBS 279.74]
MRCESLFLISSAGGNFGSRARLPVYMADLARAKCTVYAAPYACRDGFGLEARRPRIQNMQIRTVHGEMSIMCLKREEGNNYYWKTRSGSKPGYGLSRLFVSTPDRSGRCLRHGQSVRGSEGPRVRGCVTVTVYLNVRLSTRPAVGGVTGFIIGTAGAENVSVSVEKERCL